jgi:hypothetical protein
MREMYSICKLNNIAHFWLRDEDTMRFIRWQLERGAEIRKVQTEEDGEYFSIGSWRRKSELLKDVFIR